MRLKVTVPVELKKYPKLKPEELTWYIADSLRVEQARSVEADETRIRFSAGFFRSFLNWTPISTIHGGEIRFQVDTKRILVVSRLSFADTVVIASVLTGLLAFVNSRTIFVGEGDAIFYTVEWVWFVAGTMLFSIYRWRRFIRSCVRETAQRVYISREQLMANKQMQR